MQVEKHVLGNPWNNLKTNDPACSRRGPSPPPPRTCSLWGTSAPAINSPSLVFFTKFHKVWFEVLRHRKRIHFHENVPVDGTRLQRCPISWKACHPRRLVLKSTRPKTVKTSYQPGPENHSPKQGLINFPAGRLHHAISCWYTALHLIWFARSWQHHKTYLQHLLKSGIWALGRRLRFRVAKVLRRLGKFPKNSLSQLASSEPTTSIQRLRKYEVWTECAPRRENPLPREIGSTVLLVSTVCPAGNLQPNPKCETHTSKIFQVWAKQHT